MEGHERKVQEIARQLRRDRAAMREFRLSDGNVPLPRGTDVVLRVDLVAADGSTVKAGTAGRVDVGHHHTYEVVTPAGVRVVAGRDQLAIQRREVAERLVARTIDFAALSGAIVYRAVVGSVAWGLAGEGSDVDVRGVFVLPFERHSSLYRQPDQIDDPDGEAAYWEFEKFLHLLLRSDANAIELLWSPRVLHAEPVARHLRERRRDFLSNNVVGSFGRYALSQMEKIEHRLELEREGERVAALVRDGVVDRGELRRRLSGDDRAAGEAILKAVVNSVADRGLIEGRDFGGLIEYLSSHPGARLFADRPYRPKNAYNLLRLLHSGIRLVSEGEPLIEVSGPVRTRLLAVKAGEVPIEEVVAEARELGRRLEEAATRSVLPDEPPFALADRLLREARIVAARRALRPGISPGRPGPAEPAPDDSTGPARPAGLDDFLRDRMAEGVVQLGLVGAHAYGFPSPDSDLDLKGIHVVPAEALLGLRSPPETVDRQAIVGGMEIDFTSHEVAMALRLLLAGNGNVLERLVSPHQLVRGRIPEALRRMARASVGTHFAAYYRGFFLRMRRDLSREEGRTAKTLLYAYRVALTGTHLFRTGEVVLDVRPLAERYGHAEVPRLVAAKGLEQATIPGGVDEAALDRLEAELERAVAASPLPPAASNASRVERWLRALRRARLSIDWTRLDTT